MTRVPDPIPFEDWLNENPDAKRNAEKYADAEIEMAEGDEWSREFLVDFHLFELYHAQVDADRKRWLRAFPEAK